MEWYYSENGERRGPVSEGELRTLIESGAVNNDDLVWRDGLADWIPVSQASEFAGAGVAAPAQPVAAANPYQPPVASPYAPPQAASMPARALPEGTVPNYLWQSIVVTILCCWPFGIPAIVFAAKVNGLLTQGDLAGAQQASKQAKMWTWISFGLGLTFIVLYVIVVVVAGVSGVAEDM